MPTELSALVERIQSKHLEYSFNEILGLNTVNLVYTNMGGRIEPHKKNLGLGKLYFVKLILKKFRFKQIMICRNNNLEFLQKLWFEDKITLMQILLNMLFCIKITLMHSKL